MQGAGLAREELLAYVDAYRHQRETHRRAAEGTHARTSAAARMKEVERAFEQHLHGWGADEPLREAWRNAFHHGGELPLQPEPLPVLLFKGRSEAGFEVRAVRAKDGPVEIYVDGGMVRRLNGLSLRASNGRTWFDFDATLVFQEEFDAPPEAVDALRAWIADPSRNPPLEHAAALAADGLTDRNFALTQRGRRAVRSRELAAV